MTPELFGKYLLLERLASGGMGEVFLAKAGARGFERYFALKRILTQHESSTEFVQMLMNEAKITISLIHPNIAQVFEFGRIAGSFYLAMEYIEGLSLASVLATGTKTGDKLSLVDALSIARQVCQALDYAHDKTDTNGSPLGIVHRDVSPQNILVDRNGTVKLIDFGIAKASSSQSLTNSGAIRGKVSYMSPEQARGEPLDTRSDIFAAGIILYEILTYKRLFGGSDSVIELLNRVQTADVPPIETIVKTTLPPLLVQTVHRALAPKREERYQLAREMEHDLSKVLNAVDPGYMPRALGEYVRGLNSEGDTFTQRLKLFTDLHVDDFQRQRLPTVPYPKGSTEGDDFDAVTRLEAGPQQAELSVEIAAEPKRHTLLIAGLLALAVAVGAGGFFFVSRGDRAGSPSATDANGSNPSRPVRMRTLAIETEPAGAEVFVDDAIRGYSPLLLTDLAADRAHAIRIEKTGFGTEQRSLEEKDATAKFTFKLVAKETAADIARNKAKRATPRKAGNKDGIYSIFDAVKTGAKP